MNWKCNVKLNDTVYAYLWEDNSYKYAEFKVTGIFEREWFTQYIVLNSDRKISFNLHRADYDKSKFCLNELAWGATVSADPTYKFNMIAMSKQELDSLFDNIMRGRKKFIDFKKKYYEKEEQDLLRIIDEHSKA